MIGGFAFASIGEFQVPYTRLAVFVLVLMAGKLASVYGGWEELAATFSLDSFPDFTSGTRLFIVSHPRHRESGFCVMRDLASMALCHLPARQRCKNGDVVVCVTPPIEGRVRLLMGWFVITQIVCDVPAYMRQYRTRKDAIYTVSTKFSKNTGVGSFKKIEVVEDKTDAWKVIYGNCPEIVFRLKRNAKYHRTTPQPHSRSKAWLGAKTITERSRDFRSRVLLSNTFWRSSTSALYRRDIEIPEIFSSQWKRRLRGGMFFESHDFRNWLSESTRSLCTSNLGGAQWTDERRPDSPVATLNEFPTCRMDSEPDLAEARTFCLRSSVV